MKKLVILLVIIPVIVGCVPTGEIFSDNPHPKYLQDDQGATLVGCKSYINYKNEIRYSRIELSESKEFWQKHNLPKGTLYWVCEGGKALLPKDCQGNSLTTPELRRYWKKYDLPVGRIKFDCNGGTPSPK